MRILERFHEYFNAKELGGDLRMLGGVAAPWWLYGSRLWDMGASVAAGHPEALSIDFALAAGLIGSSVVGAWVGHHIDRARGRVQSTKKL